jgi:hypothetical protein
VDFPEPPGLRVETPSEIAGSKNLAILVGHALLTLMTDKAQMQVAREDEYAVLILI